MLPSDKIGHFLAGIAAAALAYPFGAMEAAIAVAAIAIGKEVVWDWWLGRGTSEPADALATMIGGALLLSWYVFGTGYL